MSEFRQSTISVILLIREIGLADLQKQRILVRFLSQKEHDQLRKNANFKAYRRDQIMELLPVLAAV